MKGDLEIRYENPPEPSSIRRTGRTTRLVDQAVQTIFSGKRWTSFVHYQFGRNRQSNERLFQLVLKRLSAEHAWISNKIEVEPQHLWIELKKK